MTFFSAVGLELLTACHAIYKSRLECDPKKKKKGQIWFGCP